MRVFGAAVMAGILSIGVAQAQAIMRPGPPGLVIASDLDGPYDAGPELPQRYAPSPYPPRAYGPPPEDYGPYGSRAYAPPVLPIHEIYRIVRESGYSPLGAPQQRGAVYTITVLDPDGDDGRLVIDARNGRIVRFISAYRYGARSIDDVNVAYGPSMLSPMPRPSARSMQARASVPLPKPRSATVRPLPEKSATIGESQQVAIPPAPTAALAAAPPQAAMAVQAEKPSVTLQPTQPLPPAQGVD